MPTVLEKPKSGLAAIDAWEPEPQSGLDAVDAWEPEVGPEPEAPSGLAALDAWEPKEEAPEAKPKEPVKGLWQRTKDWATERLGLGAEPEAKPEPEPEVAPEVPEELRPTGARARGIRNEVVGEIDARERKTGIAVPGHQQDALLQQRFREEGIQYEPATPFDPAAEHAEFVRTRNEQSAYRNWAASSANSLISYSLGIQGLAAKANEIMGGEWTPEDVAKVQDDVRQGLQPQGGVTGFLGEVTGNVIWTVPFLLSGAGVATKVLPAIFGAVAAGSTFVEVAGERAKGAKISPTEEYATAAVNGLAEYLFERVGMKWIMKGAAGMGGWQTLKEGAREAAKGGLKPLLGWVAKKAALVAGNAAQQAAEEGATEIAQGIATRLGYKKGAEYGQAEPEWEQFPEEIGRAMGAAVVATAPMMIAGVAGEAGRPAAAQPTAPEVTPKEAPHAEEIREDAGQVPEEGVKPPAREVEGREVVQRPEEARPEARVAEVQEEVAAPEVAEKPAEKAEVPEAVEEGPTSIKLESVAEARARRKLEPVPAAPAESKQEWVNEARASIEKDPELPARLIAEQTENPRALDPVEVAVLQVHRRTVSSAYETATDKFFAADESGDVTAKEEAHRAVEVYESQMQAMEEASKAAGTEWARSGVARQLALQQDYSLAGMIRRARVANEGKPLSTKVRARIRRQATRIAKLQEKIGRQDYAKPAKRKAAPLTGKALELQHELERVKAEYRRGVYNLKLKNRSMPMKVVGGVAEVFNVARALMTSFDLSAVLRQGGFGAIGHPVRAAKSFPAMIRALLSEKRRFAVEQEIHNRPNAKLYKSSGLYLSRRGAALSEMEEAYMSRWAEKIPGIAASERAYTTFLDKFRVESFDAMVKSLGRNGEVTAKEAKAIANFVNVATGRGSLGMRANAHTVLNTIFFAPRLVASRFQMLAAQPLYGGTWRTRAMIAMEYARFLAGIGLLYGLVSVTPDDWDWETELDPRSADFGKIKIGNTRLDPLVGLSQVTVFSARMIMGKTKTQRGEIVPIRGQDVPYGYGTGMDVLARFLRSKLSPMSGTFVNVFAGKDYIGEPVTIGTTVKNVTIPMAMRDIYDAMRDVGVPKGTAIGLLAILGVSMQTYAPKGGRPRRAARAGRASR